MQTKPVIKRICEEILNEGDTKWKRSWGHDIKVFHDPHDLFHLLPLSFDSPSHTVFRTCLVCTVAITKKKCLMAINIFLWKAALIGGLVLCKPTVSCPLPPCPCLPAPCLRQGGRDGWPMRGLETDHVISRPMKGLKLNITGRDMDSRWRTWHLLDWLGLEGQVSENWDLNWPSFEITKSRTCHYQQMAESTTLVSLRVASSEPSYFWGWQEGWSTLYVDWF